MHRIDCGFFFPLLSSGLTEEVAPCMSFLALNGTMLCFIVVVFFFRSGEENCVYLAS